MTKTTRSAAPWVRKSAGSLLAAALFLLSPPAVAEVPVAKSLDLAGYTVAFLADPALPFTQSLVVLKDQEEVYEGPFVAPLSALAAEPGSRNAAFSLPPGTDVTGDGTPDLALTGFTGGAHCCFSLQVLSLGTEVRLLADIAGEDSPPLLKQITEGRAYEIELADWTFAYWHAPFVEAPAPRVILRWEESRYVPALDLMRAPPLSENELERLTEEIAADMAETGKPVPALWRALLERIYSGNSDQALTLLQQAWPEDLPGREIFWLRFGAQLGLSPYYPSLARLNGWPAF
ncbi:MAG: hypothetical protein AAFY02_14425 [Pseudomonadota bacterium]